MSSGELVVRRAEARDVDALMTLGYAYIVDFYGYPRPPEAKLRALIEGLLDGVEGLQFIAERAARPIGFATLYFAYNTLYAEKAVVMHDLYLVEEEHGSGAATALFDACRDFSVDNGYPYMAWETAPDNRRAQRFYEKMGGAREDWWAYSIPTRT